MEAGSDGSYCFWVAVLHRFLFLHYQFLILVLHVLLYSKYLVVSFFFVADFLFKIMTDFQPVACRV